MSMNNPPFDAKMLEETRRHIARLVDEVGRLSEADLAPGDYFGEVLKRVLGAMAAPAGAIWTRTPQGNLTLGFQVNLREVGLDEQGKRSHDELLRQAANNPQPMHLLPHSGGGSSEEGKAAPGNPTKYLLLLVPVMLNNELQGFLEVWQSPDRPLNAIPGFLQFMGTITDHIARYQRNQLLSQMVGQQQVWTQLEAFTRQTHATLNPTEVAYLVANEGRRLVDCDRVTVGIRKGRKTRIEAVSGSDVVEKRSNLVKMMRNLFDAVLKWGEKLVYTGNKDDSLPPAVLKALDAYLAESNSKVLVLLPLRDEREKESKKPVRSGLLMECFDTTDEVQQVIGRLEIVGRHAVSALYNATEYRRIPLRWLWLPLAKVQEGIGGRGRMIVLLILLALGGIASLMTLKQWPLKMDARGQMLPITRTWVYSPETGTVLRIYPKPNDEFLAESSLVELESAEIRQKLRIIKKEIEGLTNGVEQAKKDATNPRADAATKQRLIDAQNRLSTKVAERDSLVEGLFPHPDREGRFFVRSPLFTSEEETRRNEYRKMMELNNRGPGKWTLLNSDFRDVLNKRVDSTMPLLRLGDKESGWEIELKIPQKHLYQVMSAYKRLDVKELDVDLKVRTEPTRTFRGKLSLSRIGGEAVPQNDDNNEPEPVVTAYVELDHASIPMEERVPIELRTTGTEVLTKIRCGDAKMGYALFYGVWEFLCEKVLFAF